MSPQNKKTLNFSPGEGTQPLKNVKWYVRIAGLISFSTIIPLKIHISIEEMSRFTWIWPLIGGVIGLGVGFLGWILQNLMLPPILTATLVYSFALYFTGFHHLDGLIDMGDALMAHGDAKKKIKVMRDPNIGTGGISIFLMVAFMTVASISTLTPTILFFTLLISEIGAKLGLVTCCTLSYPDTHGTGRYFIRAMQAPFMILILLLTLLIGFLILEYLGIIGILGGVLGGIIVAFISKKHFKIATGDVLGASNEISRLFSLFVMVIGLIWII